MKYSFDMAIFGHVYGSVDAESEEQAKQKIDEETRVFSTIGDGDQKEDCEIEWEVKEPCHGNVCNAFGGGIEITEENDG